MSEIPSLEGARVLLIAPRFFGYDEAIARELRRRGAIVDAMPDRPFDSPWYHAAARFFPQQIRRATEKHYRRLLTRFGPSPYDHVMVVNGQTVSKRLLGELRASNPEARFTFYLWDSVANRGHSLQLVPLFDRAFSFERATAAQHGMRFRPLFSDDHAAGSESREEYDIAFIGTAHSDRHRIVERIDARLPATKRRFWFLYIQARWVLTAYRITNPAFRGSRESLFSFSPLPRSESQRVFEATRAILDIEHARQTGLTMRTLEVFCAGKKLVTTNADIRAYAFYDPARIDVINRDDPQISPGFLDDPAPPLAEDVRYRYTIAGWIDELLADTDQSAIHLQPDVWPA